jgi:hypothetical protein
MMNANAKMRDFDQGVVRGLRGFYSRQGSSGLSGCTSEKAELTGFDRFNFAKGMLPLAVR